MTDPLSSRELDVLDLYRAGIHAYGRPTPQRKIAEMLGISRPTVQDALRSIRRKGIDPDQTEGAA